MIVLEATGIRDVASGPLLRLSHDRFVPGLRALRDDLRGLSASLVIPQIIDFLKIARRKSTRAFVEDAVRRDRLRERAVQPGNRGHRGRREIRRHSGTDDRRRGYPV